MRIVSYCVDGFEGRTSWRDFLIRPFSRIFGSRKRQYINLWWTKKLRYDLKPDLLYLQDIYFKGRRGVPQIDLFRAELLQNIKTITPFTQYSEGRHTNYSVAFFGRYPTRAVKMTHNSHLLETSINDLSILSVHLSWKRRRRREQLRFIEGYISENIHRRFIVIGNFNIKNLKELDSLMKTCGLFKAPLPTTYPVGKLKRHTDCVLYDSTVVMKGVQAYPDSCSKHLPIIFDFELEPEKTRNLIYS